MGILVMGMLVGTFMSISITAAALEAALEDSQPAKTTAQVMREARCLAGRRPSSRPECEALGADMVRAMGGRLR